MRPDSIERRRTRSIPEIPKRRHLGQLIEIFATEKDPDIANARTKLFNELEIRSVSDRDTAAIYEFASLANWLHKGENRLTGEPFITHPLAVAFTLARSIHIPIEELKEHCISAIGHDLRENTKIKRWQLIRFAARNPANTIELLTKVTQPDANGKKQDLIGYFNKIRNYGKIPDWRVKIADWIHNLETTPQSNEGYLPEKWNKIKKLQTKFPRTSIFILPLIRKFPDGEKQYWYNLLEASYIANKPAHAPDLEPLQPPQKAL